MVRHENIIQLVDYLRDEAEDKFWVIMQLATGGDMMKRVCERFKAKRAYTESEVLLLQLCLPLQTCTSFLTSFPLWRPGERHHQ